MGQIDSSPKVQWTKAFSVKLSGSEETFFLQISQSDSLKEDGLADPTRPGGPDNRKIITVSEYSVYILNSKGELEMGEKLKIEGDDLNFSEKLLGLRDHLRENQGVKKSSATIPFYFPSFSDALIQLAKEKYQLNLEEK